ncbi:glycosyltransferase family 4 protein [Robiginitalea sp. IMCC43444]|uniref:glycosyltransferase family 4 protein n=1 Tax=Robiginitalea sp. IMCC43444 TaxID=3459121 RepID=UPI0040415E8A
MPKLLYITNSIDGAGGLERVLSIKASYLAENNDYEVHIVSLFGNNSKTFYTFSPRIKLHKLNVSNFKLLTYISYFIQIRSFVSNLSPDLISVCDDGIKGFFVPKLLKSKFPIIYERHASIKLHQNEEKPNFFKKVWLNFFYRLMRRLGKDFDYFIVLTKGNLREWPGLNNLRVIPNPLPFNSAILSNHNNKTVICVANHGYQKGIDRLLKIWKIVSTQHDEWKLHIYGKKDQGEKFVEMAKALKIATSVCFYDPVRDIAAKYQESSIYALTSRSEGFGMVLIEAMNHGVPCIAFDCPSGPRDIILSNHDGYLVPDGDIKLFAESLLYLMSNKEIREIIGEKAHQSSKKYLPENICEMWDTLFRSLV